ncbi:hypothetical protein ACFV83_14885 [Streptomyces pharetrae]|uniref:hypothetical protein n=1 Tax=Streptomyces pharetrae TaxID=291370 RepID=UPI00364BC5AF
MAAFQNIYGPAVRPGPALATSAERRAAEALRPLPSAVTAATLRKASKNRPRTTASVEPATTGDHEALLDEFLNSHGDIGEVPHPGRQLLLRETGVAHPARRT